MLAELAFPIPLRRTFYYLLPDELELAAAPGLRALAPLGKREAVGVILRVLPEKDADLSGFKELKSVIRLLDEEPLFPEDAVSIASWMSGRWGSPLGLCLGAFFAHSPKEPAVPPPPPDLRLASPAPEMPELAGLLSAFSAGNCRALLRLEPERSARIYPAVFKAALSAPGSQGLLLVPDISFVAPMEAALDEVFPGLVASWHARLTPRKRAETWAGAASGLWKAVVATRTGAFLPFRDLRLAAMDNEHEEVYRQEEAEPFYHAREVLLRRAAARGSSVLLASPCPSIEAWGAASSGELRRFDDVPPAGAPRPSAAVSVLDMTQYPGEMMARPLADSLRSTVLAGGQAILIAGRKGYASRLFCANCGWMPRCPDCGPGMTIAKDQAGAASLLCRRCGRREPKPQSCPSCGGKVFRDCGTGTQKAQEAVSRLLPSAKVSRFDGDVLRGSMKVMQGELDSFSRGEADVLVGTRIALRDLGAPRLKLIAFVDADADLSSADFRSSEKAFRTFYWAWRLLGRGGELFIQSREAGHYVFSRLNEMDYPSFADDELASRRDFLYPPFCHIVKARFASFDRGAVDAAASDLKRALSFLGRGGEVIGPVTPAGQEKRKFFSEYYLVKAVSEADAARCLAAAQALKPRPGVKYFIDADPQGGA